MHHPSWSSLRTYCSSQRSNASSTTRQSPTTIKSTCPICRPSSANCCINADFFTKKAMVSAYSAHSSPGNHSSSLTTALTQPSDLSRSIACVSRNKAGCCTSGFGHLLCRMTFYFRGTFMNAKTASLEGRLRQHWERLSLHEQRLADVLLAAPGQVAMNTANTKRERA